MLFSNVHSKFTASALGCSEETLFISFSKGVTGIAHAWRKTQKNGSCLICDSSCCRTSCVSVQLCTPKVLPNTETFLHSRVFFVTCVVPALCQIMYSLSVCSDGTTSAAPRSFRQNRPPARTLSVLGSSRLGCTVRACAEHDFGRRDMVTSIKNGVPFVCLSHHTHDRQTALSSLFSLSTFPLWLSCFSDGHG